MKIQAIRLIGLILTILCLSFCAMAQENAVVSGTVTDPSGAAIPKASVTMTNVGTGDTRTSISNDSGIYNFSNLNTGHYTLSVHAPGFKTYSATDIVLNIAQTLKRDISLNIGSQGETVTVKASALQLQAETNQVSDLISGKQVTQLATNGRNVTQLAILGMGVSTNDAAFDGVNALTSGNSISFSGTRPSHNVYMIDGGELNDRGCGGCFGILPSLDALSQFKTLDSNYTPDYGIGSGGQIIMVLRSGTSSFHGGLWEFNRNDAFDANNYISKLEGQSKPELRLNIFGGNLGGPLFIPRIYNENRKKTFFFVNEEGRRLIVGSAPTVTPTVPASDFPVAGQPLVYTPPSNGVVPVVPATQDPARLALYKADGLTPGQPFPNNTIPANLIDQNAVLFMGTGVIPKPNASNGTNSFITSVKQPTYVREDLVRIDHNINDKLQLMGHYIHDAVSQTYVPPLWSNDSYPTVGSSMENPSWSAVIQLTQLISPSVLNETSFDYDGNKIHLNPTGTFAQPSGWGAQGYFSGNNALNRLPEIDLGAPYGTNWSSSYFPWHNAAEDYQVRDDLSWTKGRHNFKFGVSYMRFIKNQGLQANTQGTYGFTTPSFSGDSYVNFLLGDASSYSQLQSLNQDHWVNNTYSGYANDNWNITSRLTLNLGLRYDGLPHAFERYNRFANFIPGDYSAANAPQFNSDGSLNPNGPGFSTPAGFTTPFYLNGMQLAGVNGFPRGAVRNYYGTIMPRVGFAWNVGPDSKTVLRGGFGLFYERVQGNDVYNAGLNPPFAFQPSANNVYFSDPHISALTGTASTSYYYPASLTNLAYNYKLPATAQYSLGLQREIVPSVIGVLQYVGTTGWHQDDNRDINTLPLNSPFRQGVASGTVNPNPVRQFPGYSNITQEEVATNSRYNSLQAGLRMEEKHGLTMQLAYTWSHELDVTSSDLVTVSNPFNLRYDFGSGSLDRRNIFNANFIYALPFFMHAQNALLRSGLGGWEISDVTVAESGTPVNVTYSPDVIGLGGGTTNRPNFFGMARGPKTQKQFFNTAAFSAPVAPWAGGANEGFGNARKDTIVGPGTFNFNLALFKSFNLTSDAAGPSFQFRLETFNTFNHTQFLGIDTGFTDSTFGQVTTAQDPRVLQLGAKLLF
ncbi:TonB-dependent receptor [Acidipila rosea]|uniref:Carboxypeptidase family protein n=1 Tax=Acidipila rosea TaxID=768535 RepID=A0A4R1LFD1_9BACT|nr:TonB-dependent receptor [Acidipila rosea]MBW4027354.1 TonB-dependent receptor [Acidobacteriota bacterium]TCK75573.1 carboxypeptidase family protein [Acidipila rosea]